MLVQDRNDGWETITKTEKIKDQRHGADVILATSNSHKAIVDSVKGLRPDGRLILMGASATNDKS